MSNTINFVLIGHVDHGKSTCGGRLLVDTNTVTQQDVDKALKEAEMNNMRSWWLAYLLDTDEEKLKGKTHEHTIVPINYNNHVMNLIDVPGHSKYVKEMIVGTSKADVCVLLCSAKKGEIEDGIKGQTLEHLMIARGLGVTNLVVAINKMDHKTVDWDNQIYEDKKKIVNRMIGKFKFKNINYIPISALNGDNIVNKKNGTEKCLLDLVIENSEKKLNELIYTDKTEIKVKCLFVNIDTLVTLGYSCVVHSGDQYVDCTIDDILEPIKFIKKNHKNYVTLILKLEKPIDLYSSIILRDDVKTVAMGIIV